MRDFADVLGGSSTLLDPAELRRKAMEAEHRGDWSAAQLAWERVIDRSPAMDEQLFEATAHLRAMRDKRKPINTDPAKARSWRTLAVLFRTLDFTWTDKEGVVQHVKTELSDADEQRIRASLKAFGDQMFQLTDGILRVDLDVVIIEKPLTTLWGKYSFGPGLKNLRPTVEAAMGDKPYECVFAYVKFRQSGEKGVPAGFSAAATGADIGPKGAGFIEIPWNPDANYAVDGELELHEWLHHVDMIWMHVLGYPQGVNVNPDHGRSEGQTGGDPTYRHPRTEKSWMPFYEHIMQFRNTRLMWSELTIHPPANPFWAGDHMKDWLICGPFGSNKDQAMAEDFIGEASAKPDLRNTAGGKPWQRGDSLGGVLRQSAKGDEQVLYAATTIQAGPGSMHLWLKNDAPVSLWVNGKPILSAAGPSNGDKPIEVPLAGGDNLFLFKIARENNEFRLDARLSQTNGVNDWGHLNHRPADAALAGA
jgi:hypothetical protein